jgi:4,5-dihydroxyphthalate decarboxylase
MTDLNLRIGHTYSDRIAPLLEGTIRPDAVTLDFTLGTADELFHRMLHTDDFELAEMSLGAHVVLTSRQEGNLAGLPVFPSRMFRHSAIYVHDGIKSPGDLAGGAIGTPEYQMTASIWVRQLLASRYNVDWRKVRWFSGGLNSPGRTDRIKLRAIEGLSVTAIGPDANLSTMLETRQLDAIISAQPPSCFTTRRVRQLIEDVRTAEVSWYHETGVIPIMHLLVAKRTVLEEHPWLAAELTRAFAQAQELARQRLRRSGNPTASLVWLDEAVVGEHEILGDNPFHYGGRDNRLALEMFLEACRQQELLDHDLTIDELFWPGTMDLVI